MFQKQENRREATGQSLLKGKRVNIFGSNNPKIAYCPGVHPGWKITWLEKLGVYVCGVTPQDLQERGMYAPTGAPPSPTLGPEASFGDVDGKRSHSHSH